MFDLKQKTSLTQNPNICSLFCYLLTGDWFDTKYYKWTITAINFRFNVEQNLKYTQKIFDIYLISKD